MKMALALSVGVLAAGMFAATWTTASAQSDRTLGINCTVAGHEHCGEAGAIWGRSYGWRHHYSRHYPGAYAYARDCRVVRQRVETSRGVIYRSRQVCD
jgi:hypothetical protein